MQGGMADRSRKRKALIWAVRHVLKSVSEQEPNISFVAEFPGDRACYGTGSPQFVICFRDEKSLRRLLWAGGLGFGEEYMRGGIAVEGDLQSLLHFAFAPTFRSTRHAPAATVAVLQNRLGRFANRINARRNAQHHYDLGTDFYRAWLDDSLTYSCAYFEGADDDLYGAQMNKYRHICRKLRLVRGESLVDIGCGWGGMMFYAAERIGARCEGYTLSKDQYNFIREERVRRGLEGRIQVHLKDYREAEGQFDKFVSIGMFEHVGRKYYRTFFRKARELLKPGGIGVLHTIGGTDRMPINPWITRYIFPGGYLPTLEQITGAMARENLWVYDLEDLHLHYARTLDEWARRFEVAIPMLDLEDPFVRMWRLYLNGCSVGFKRGITRLYQAAFTREKSIRVPSTRKYIYADPMPA